MLHENPLMLGIDVGHWRNLQSLLLDSAKGRRRIIVIHENGEILKCVHSQRRPIHIRSSWSADNPHALAEAIYRDNADDVDFVAVFERNGFDEYFSRFQSAWKPDEDLDTFVHRTYALMDEYPDAIVTYPRRARHVLGLQWRIGATHEQVSEAVRQYVPPESTVLVGIFDGNDLWATLVLGFDADQRINVVTTVDPSQLATTTTRLKAAEELVRWVNGRYAPCSLGLFTSLELARAFLKSESKMPFLQQLAENDDLIANPIPDGFPLTELATSY